MNCGVGAVQTSWGGGAGTGGGGGSSTFSPRLGYDVAMMSGDEIEGVGSVAKKMKSSMSDIGSVDNGEFSPDEKVPPAARPAIH